MTETDTPPSDAVATAVRPRPRLPMLWITLALVLIATVMTAGFVAWAIGSDAGTRALLGVAPGLRVTGPQGSLLGGDFSAERVEIQLTGRDRVVLEGVAWHDLIVRPDPAQAWRFSIHVASLNARSLRVELPEPSRGPKPVPASMTLPFAIAADRVEIGTLTAPGLQAPGLTDVRGRVTLGADDGRRHEALDLQATFGPLALKGQAQMGSRAPLTVDARLDATRPGDGLGWTATATARGPLAALPLQVEVRARDQRLDAQATLTPFALEPLSDIVAEAQRFDLQALHPRAPRTALTGSLRARLPSAASSPAVARASGELQLEADVRNEQPAGLDQGGLPVAALKARASGHPTADKAGARRFTLTEATLDLADGSGPAGRVTARGDGAFSGSAQGAPTLDARVDATVDGLRTRGLDSRAPALVFSGPVKLAIESLPLGGRAQGPARLDAQVDVKGQWLEGGRVATAAAAPFALDSTAQALLTREVETGDWRVQSITLAKAQVRADAGLASVNASLTAGDRTPGPTRWRLQIQGGLRDFDLRVLGVGSHAARAAQQLSATMRADLNGPAPTGPMRGSAAWMQWASNLRGDASVNLANSRVAGMPLDGKLTLQSGAEAFWQLDSMLDAGGNHLQLEGRIGRSGDGATDQWAAQVRSGDLGTLVPLAQAFGIELPALQGQMSAEGKLEGRWPQVQSAGRMQAGALALGPSIQADQFDAQWQFGTRGDAPLNVDLTATHLRSGAERLNTLKATAKGTARAHTVSVQSDRAARPPRTARAAASPPPAWMQALFAQADAEGSLKAEGDALQWSGRVRNVALQPVDASGARGAPWLKAEPFDLAWRQDARQRSFTVSPTLVRLFSAELRVARLAWSHAGAEVPQFDLQADLTPLDVAPLLQRAQPDFGWSGDLKLGGHVRLKRDAAGVVTDIEIARLGGDLMITEDTGTQRLGLDALKVTVASRNGVWRASEILSGRNLGLLKGEQTVQTDPQAYAPDATSALAGQLNLQIEQLGSLGAWLPVATVGAGWRLSGSLDTALRLGGRLGAPLYTGELRGQKIGVRNGLEGVNLTDGTIDMVMSGEEARIRQFVVKAGDGTATLSGQATFGEAPQATLQLVADRFALLQRVDRRVMLSGDGQVTLDATTTRITGALRVDEGLFDISRRDAPSIGDDVDVVQPETQTTTADTTSRPPPKRRNQIDLRINAGDHLRLRGRGLDTLLKGELRFATNAANRLQVTGTILAEDGTYTAYGQKLNLEKGRLEFRGAGDNPRLDIEAIRPPAPGSDDTAVRVGVAITGTAQDPRVRLFSEPEMSETDKLAWLVLGRSSDGLGRTDLIVLQRAAVALLSDEGDDPSQGVFGKLGIDELSVSQGDGQVKETIVKVGKQLSQRWYVGYERSLNATSGTWQLLYRIAQRYSIRAQAQQGGASSLDFIWTWRWE